MKHVVILVLGLLLFSCTSKQVAKEDWSLEIVLNKHVQYYHPFYVILKNCSTEDLTLYEEACSLGYHNLSFEITLQNRQKYRIEKGSVLWSMDFPRPYTVSSGHHYVYAVTLSESIWEGLPEYWKEQDIKVKAIFNPKYMGANNGWTGYIESDVYEVRLVGK